MNVLYCIVKGKVCFGVVVYKKIVIVLVFIVIKNEDKFEFFKFVEVIKVFYNDVF